VRLAGLRSAYVEMLCTRGSRPGDRAIRARPSTSSTPSAVPYVWIANEEQRAAGCT
jgi:branched-chain amino acid aminotransferase